MFIESGKTYRCHLLRQSFRQNGKVKHRTLANLSHCSDEEIAAFKLALKHKGNLADLGSIEEISAKQGKRIGAVLCLKTIAERIGLSKALGYHRQGRLALWQVLARCIGQGSRLGAVRLAESHSACDLLGLDAFNEDNLYGNLTWLSEHQEVIERRLFRRCYGSVKPQLFLYDVTSSYLEGTENALAAFGYNRDGKKGKMQLVIGLLTGEEGTPVAVRVFEGNTPDARTVGEQVRILAESFGVERVTVVGDRGMLKQVQTDALNEKGFHYITAITKAQIKRLLREDVFQMELFEGEICEVESEGVRYILRRNPQRAEEVRSTREGKLARVKRLVDKRNLYLAEHRQARIETAVRAIEAEVERLRIGEWVKVVVNERALGVRVDEGVKEEVGRLDGCYVIKTDLPAEVATAETVHARYKDLTQVERAFRTFKSGGLEVRPAFVRREESTRGHVFVVMLAYLVERELERCWRGLETTVPEGIDELGSLRAVEIEAGGARCQKVPKATGSSDQLLEAADIHLPEMLPLRSVHVATRKKLVSRRLVS
ncbi:MAG: hypothetical protein DDT33_01062 [Firmicutes bacterium]|nr:hypothetical protein [Bacillota bacterium]